jgi:hypothetical protein
MGKLEKEYEKVRTKVENGKSFVHCKGGVVIVCTSNRRPTARMSGDFVACGLYEKEAIACQGPEVPEPQRAPRWSQQTTSSVDYNVFLCIGLGPSNQARFSLVAA